MARRRHPNRRRHRGSFSFLYKVLSILLVCVVVVVALTLFFRVNLILVEGEQRYTEEEVRKATQVADGDNLFLMNKYEVANNILSALPYVEEIRINRKLPDTLVVEVRECGEPLAIVQEGCAWLISPAGKIVRRILFFQFYLSDPDFCPGEELKKRHLNKMKSRSTRP